MHFLIKSSEQGSSVIELDQHLLPDGVSTNANSWNVDIVPLSLIYNAESVHLEPISANDWELLEIHADELESGSLLSQVCVIYPNQRLPIRLGRYGDVAWVKVLGSSFEKSGVDAESESDSESSFEGFNHFNEKLLHECLRLVANTEVVVVPKLRADDSSHRLSLPKCNLCVLPTDKDYSSEMKDLFSISSDIRNDGRDDIKSIGIPECPPWFTGAVHSSTFEALTRQTNMETKANGIDQKKEARAAITGGNGSSYMFTKAFALVVISDDVPHGCIGESWNFLRSATNRFSSFASR